MISHLIFIIFSIIDWLIEAYILVLFLRMILDWVFVLSRGFRPHGAIATIVRIIYALTDPPLRWLRQYFPPINLGRIQFDTSFLVLYFALIILRVLI